MFNKCTSFKYYHIAKQLYLTSHNVVIDFSRIGSSHYCRVYHKSGLPILIFDKPIKNQKYVLDAITPFLALYNFNESKEQVLKEVLKDENLLSGIRRWQETLKKDVTLN